MPWAPPSDRSWWVLTKGAPEVVQGLLGSVPQHYERCYKVGMHASRVSLLACSQTRARVHVEGGGVAR